MKNETYIITGKTVEEAMTSARAQYGSPDKELSFTILEMPTKGFLGFGAKPAKIQVTVSRALEEVNLSDLVSDLKNMKLTTDRDGDDVPEKKSTPKPQQNLQKKQQNQTASPKQKPAQQNQPKKQNPPKQEQKKPEPKPAPAEVKEAKPESAAKAEVRTAKPETAAKAESKETKAEPAKAEVKEIKEIKEIKEVKAEEPAGQPETAHADESDLPAALRTPAHRSNPPKKKNQKKPASPKAQDSKSGEEKKKDLLSAVMATKPAPAQKPADAAAQEHAYGISSVEVSVTPTVMKHKAESAPEVTEPAEAKEAMEPKKTKAEADVNAPAGRPERTVAEAVDAALAVFAAQEPAPLPEDAEEAEKNREIPVEFVTPEKLQLALDFVNTLLRNIHLDAEAVPATTGAEPPEDAEEGVVEARVEITGKDTGLLIGHHGETLDAIQTLMNLSANRRDSDGRRDYVKIVLDMADYRRKREDTLRALARRTAARVVKYKRNIVLEPMNPYERRVIHSELHNVEDVSTHSVGSDENRKIVITYEGADKQTRRPRGDRRRRGEKGEKPEAQSREKAPKEEKPERARPRKPARAKSIDEVQIDLSEENSKTFGSIEMDEGIETGVDPIEEIARADEVKEENLREY